MGRIYYQKDDKNKALRLYKAAADQGHAKTSYELAKCMLSKKNVDEAKKYLSTASTKVKQAKKKLAAILKEESNVEQAKQIDTQATKKRKLRP